MEENIWTQCERERNARLVYRHLSRKLFWAKMKLGGWILLLAVFLALSCLSLFGCAAKQPMREYVREVSIDVGAELRGLDGFYPSAGVSFPIKGAFLSTGVWGVREQGENYYGHYLSLGWSWSPFQ